MNRNLFGSAKHFSVAALVCLLTSGAVCQTTFYYSVDIGSDLEYSDPYAWMVPPQSNNEYMDPGKIYKAGSAGGQSVEVKKDALIFAQVPLPEPGNPVPVGPNDNPNPQDYFDLDGEDQLDLVPGGDWPLQGPVEISASPAAGLLYNPPVLYYSEDDDGAPGWWSAPPSDVPVMVAPDKGSAASQDELRGAIGWRVWPLPGTPVTDESGLTLDPNPPGTNNDDDVDALDTRLYRYWFWTCDHEAHYGLDPGAIYVTDTGIGANYSLYVPRALLGIPAGTDVDAFEFCVTDDPDILQYFVPGGPAPTTYLAVIFSVDQDDPTTPNTDESGGLSPGTIYISLLTGAAPMALAEVDGDVDAIALEEAEQPSDPTKWIQRPDLGETGVDVCGTIPNLLADDFQCTTNQAITNIVIWASWRYDEIPNQDPGSIDFMLSFHADIPASQNPNGYSEPAEPPLWLRYFAAGTYMVEMEMGGINEWWYRPDLEQPELVFPGDHICWKYTFPVPMEEAFVQTGSVDNAVVYWLDAQVMSDMAPTYYWGWKSSLDHWNDDAVWTLGMEGSHLPWFELRYPMGHPMAPESMDLAFALYGGDVPQEELLDWGDAPDNPGAVSYPTLSANNGANHLIGGPWLGDAADSPDSEPDGQPNATATGDDADGNDDEDGVLFPVMIAGLKRTVTFEVRGASAPAVVEIWIDWNRNASWSDAVDGFYTYSRTDGVYSEGIQVPLWVASGTTYARCRISTSGTGTPLGTAPDGEVEDHQITLQRRFDFGDAPDPTYPTLNASGGAMHVVGGPWLGDATDAPDIDADGQPNATATGDDADGNDDENGVVLPAYIRQDRVENFTVTVSGTCRLNGWVDFNIDGDWGDSGEQIFTDVALAAGSTNLTVSVPLHAAVGTTCARFRVSTAGGDGPGGFAADGEVEDYTLVIREKFPPELGLKWRQPPDCDFGLNLNTWAATDQAGVVYESPVIADDWWCDGRPINAIRWWGSYILYSGPIDRLLVTRPTGFRLRWYLDIPAAPDGSSPSKPGPLLKQQVVTLLPYQVAAENKDKVTERYLCTVPLDFLGPDYAGMAEHKFEYEVILDKPWMEKNTLSREHYEPPCSSNIYWISIEALYDAPPDPLMDYVWGWETTCRRFNWNDAAVVATNMPAGTITPWNPLAYIPQLWPWYIGTEHPYMGERVNMAFAMLSEVVGRRDVKWQQLPNMIDGTDMPSWRYIDPYRPAPPWSQTVLRADDFISDGRRITDIHWWGSYIGWQADYYADEFNPVVPPLGIEERPLGFDLSWHRHNPASGGPGVLLTNVFIPMARCNEMYYCTIPQGRSPYLFEHEYQYYVDLLDEQLDTLPWSEIQGEHYWLNIQAVFATNFIPAMAWEAGLRQPHEGWGWKIAGIAEGIPGMNLEPSVVSTNFVPVTYWNMSVLPWWHRYAFAPHDLAFELTTDQPDTNRTINITSILRDEIDDVYVGSKGTGNAGIQILQKAASLKPSPVTWINVETNQVPFPLPWTNTWLRAASPDSNEFYRVIEFTP